MPRIGIVACEVMKGEVEKVIGGDPEIVAKKFLKFGLHNYPEDVKAEVLKEVNNIKDMCDVIMVGYGYCGGPLKGLDKETDIPVVMPEEDDCIHILLTSKRAGEERKKNAGTFFLTPGWCDEGVGGLKKMLDIQKVAEETGVDSGYIFGLLFQNYNRALYIDTGIVDKNAYTKLAKDIAEELGLKYEKTRGTLENLKKLYYQAKNHRSKKILTLENGGSQND